MKKTYKILILGLLAIGLVSCEKDESLGEQTKVYSNADDSNIEDSYKDRYSYAASIWANYYRTDDKVTIPEDLYSRYYDALVQIYNAENLYGTDSIDDVYYSLFPHYSDGISYLYLEVDSNENWYNNWIADSITTGNDSIDQLVSKYDFEIINDLNNGLYGVGPNDNPFFQLWTSSYVNMDAVAKEFEKIQGITYSKTRNKYVLGISIHVTLSHIAIMDSTDRVHITYYESYSWLNTRKWWKFASLDNGIVEFVEKY